MKNKYGLPEKELERTKTRDKTCVYCHKVMIEPSSGGDRKDWATIEHLNHLPPWDKSATVAYCCGSCNSSRSNKRIIDWFETSYCIGKNINFDTVAQPVRDYVRNYEK
ncbi:MAG: hypothetical protein HQ402_00615 [Parcubacteria group bacterium]|nr:hypothetical protein [Parcubacteria group bacterium]